MEKQRLLFEAVFKRMPSAPETCSWLQEVAAAHPYFSAAQFFLLQQTASGDPDYPLQARKTSVLFNNPGWLQFQLLKSGQHPAPAVIPESLAGNPEPSAEAPAQEEEVSTEASLPEHPVSEADTDIPVSLSPGEITPEPVPEPVQESEPEVSLQIETPAGVKAAEIEVETNDINTPSGPDTVPAHIPLPEPVSGEPALLFEPLHTTDYFASVGIKLSEQEKTNDRLGKQLKSFTDWLKTMKKVPGSQPDPGTRPEPVEAAASESHIRHLAEQSNQEGEVLTEAMAGVLLQQGRKEKAIEILEKLSLLNPAKSTYFAAKIHQIKGD